VPKIVKDVYKIAKFMYQILQTSFFPDREYVFKVFVILYEFVHIIGECNVSLCFN